MIANQPLTDTDGAAATLPSTGFAAADILQVFLVPEGFQLYNVGASVITAEGGACTGDIGIITAAQNHLASGAADNLVGTLNLNSAVVQPMLVGDTLGGTAYMGTVFITNGEISLTFNTAATAVAVFDLWVTGWFVATKPSLWP